ncbi:ligase-associated DNA damage response exonuclease [Parvularcula sp. LCG005]|uniref:ligase-associated DNA damage response exonuclease n=1 Tax=Parvularcula sp. LCG005 TaxID=3078805 RepID=UPI002941FDFB|nr:ligase-associated DNA damage response exonuclease [Parvularcula sp. LCG005]WOI53801.1 ligase-associated DNA damage response exonuclease [Parvularcula sp. LCG005]
MKPEELLHPTPQGLYCPPGDFFIDPVAAVSRAIITHGHADHARAGHGAVIGTPETLAIMAARYGEAFTEAREPLAYRNKVDVNGVTVWLAPAGHVLGSAQAVIEHQGLRMVVTGDFKRRRDPTCEAFEVVPCDIFISEATFALPVFHHPHTAEEVRKLIDSLRQFPERAHLVGAYALGKAQRVICHLREEGYDEPIYIHGALQALCDLYREWGVDLGELRPATVKDDRGSKQDFAGKVIICPPSAVQTTWARRFPDPVTAFASGWMRVRQRAKQRGVELPLIISDHADWEELTRTVEDVDPRELWVTHGREDAFVRWAEINGRIARPLRLVGYEDENE